MRNDVSTPAAWAHEIATLDVPNRARVLGKLLRFVGPLALTVLSDGAFAKYLPFARSAFVPVTLEDAARATARQIYELARYLQQSHPGLLSRPGAAAGRTRLVGAELA